MTDAACYISGHVILGGGGGGEGVTEVNIFICLHHFLYVWHMSLNFCSVLIIVIPVLCCYCQECFVCKLVKREGGVGGGGGGGAILQGCALYLILLCGLKGMANVLQLVYFRSYRPSIAISINSFLFCCLIACQSMVLVPPTPPHPLFFSFFSSFLFCFCFLLMVWNTLFQATYTYSFGR